MPQPKILTLTDSSDDLDILVFNRPIAEQLPLAFTTSSMTLNLATTTLQMTVSPGADRAPVLTYGNSAFTGRSTTAANVAITKDDTDTLTPRQYYIEVRELDTGNETVLGAFLWNALSSPGYVPVIPPTPPAFISWSQVNNTPTTLAGYGITDAAAASSLARVATSGLYGDLSGLPTLGTAAAHAATDFDPSGSAAAVAASVTALHNALAAVAFSGAYGDLSGTPDSNSFVPSDGGLIATDGSGKLFAQQLSIGGNAQIIGGGFTVDASGNVIAAAIQATTASFGLTSEGAPKVNIDNAGNVAAGGSVSAGGQVLAANLSGTNTGDQDLSTLAPLIGSTINAQTVTSYALVLTDAGKLVTLSNASAITLTVPPNSTTALVVNSRIDLGQIGAGTVTVSPGSGVTINRFGGGALTFAGQFSYGSLVKRATNTWDLIGGQG